MDAQQKNAMSQTASPQHVALLLSLDKHSSWDEQYSGLVGALSAKAKVKRVVKADAALRYLISNPPSSIIITDNGLAEQSKESLDPLRQKVVDYVRQGGTAVMATHFSNFTTPKDSDAWFSKTWGLPWEFDNYSRATVHLNTSSEMSESFGTKLPLAYSQKSVFLRYVDQKAAVYIPSEGSRARISLLSPDSEDIQTVPVAMAKFGAGWLGYIGDANNETESQAVLLAMLRL